LPVIYACEKAVWKEKKTQLSTKASGLNSLTSARRTPPLLAGRIAQSVSSYRRSRPIDAHRIKMDNHGLALEFGQRVDVNFRFDLAF
jgi:hypothetical protein